MNLRAQRTAGGAAFGQARQAHWDARAAANFVLGGAGAGLVVALALAGARGRPAAIALAAGLALVVAGLVAVWFEIGRPARALNVFRHARRSWMSREAIVALFLVPVVAIAAFAHAVDAPNARAAGAAAALLALAFAWCQGRILHAAKGVPAWRSPVTPVLVVATALAEGLGLWWAAAAWHAQGTRAGLALLGVALVARLVAWLAWRRSIAAHAAAAAALAPAGRWLAWGGTLAPLALATIAASLADERAVLALAAAAGLLAFAAGAAFKSALLLRATLQGFALPRLPVRGVPREAR